MLLSRSAVSRIKWKLQLLLSVDLFLVDSLACHCVRKWKANIWYSIFRLLKCQHLAIISFIWGTCNKTLYNDYVNILQISSFFHCQYLANVFFWRVCILNDLYSAWIQWYLDMTRLLLFRKVESKVVPEC